MKFHNFLCKYYFEEKKSNNFIMFHKILKIVCKFYDFIKY